MIWNSDEIIAATGGTLHGRPFEVESVAIDSRKLQPGALFVALKGERFDGHDYLNAAFAAGAAGALAERIPEGKAVGSCILVADVYEALLALARAARARSGARIIAVTGSVGKTGTKESIRLAVGSAGKVYATQGNLNNHIGLPLTLCNMPRDTDYGVFEMGMNHAGEISFLTTIARPHVAVITNVEAVHLEFFDGIEGIASAKAEIFDGLVKGGTAVVNRDSPLNKQIYAAARARGIPDENILCFGEDAQANYRLMSYTIEPMGSRVEAVALGTPIVYHLGTTGKHWALASLAALAAATAAGADLANAAAALAHFNEPDGRGKLLRAAARGGHITLIDDCYNASPVSMKAAFSKLEELHRAHHASGRKVVVLGDMLELGDSSADLHRSLLIPLQLAGVDKVYASGAMMKHLFDMLPPAMQGAWAEDAGKLAALVASQFADGDMVLLKGSRGSRIDIVRDALQNAASFPVSKETAHAV